jgi:inorganic pyrophosphatase
MAEALEVPGSVPVYSAPKAADFSLWHDVDLHVRSWLNEDTGIFRYVNEIPLGALQKFEVMPDAPRNAISEDEKGTNGLKTYGVPVPFNYGCFPQTYRDPNDVDAISGVGGDDDPLDVLDLGSTAMDVGAVVRCRALGAVCLIDKGQADWKILTVNVDEDGPLAKARSIEEVERIMPGRVSEVLGWIDGLKKNSREGNLDWQIHGIEQAVDLLERDHASWRRLVHETGSDGRARGHWIRFPNVETSSHPATSILPVDLPSAKEDMELHGNLMEPTEVVTSSLFRDPPAR